MMALGLSQAELARRVRLSQPTIFSLVHSNKIGSKHLHRIARVLGTTPAYLSGETDDPDADAPPAPDLSHEESELLELVRSLDPKDRAAITQLASSLANSAPAATFHGVVREWRGASDAAESARGGGRARRGDEAINPP